MTLDPQAQQFLAVINAMEKPNFAQTGAELARAIHNSRPENLAPEWIEVFKVENRHIHPPKLPPLALRIYTPLESMAPLPIALFYHGGGMVIGSLDSYDRLCRQLAVQSGCILVSVDYRLAPENKFPAAVDDAYAALLWVMDNAHIVGGDKHAIAVIGDSAGGNLAAVVSILAHEAQLPPIKGQALIYPATAPEANSASQLALASGYFLERTTILWFHDSYIRTEADRQDFRYAPLIADDLSGLPPAFIIVAEYDPLRDEGVAYATRLKNSGVAVELQEYRGMFHPFLSLAGILDQGKRAITDAALALRCFFMSP
jgi:acetyl esterase